jgi:hypothetical protein
MRSTQTKQFKDYTVGKPEKIDISNSKLAYSLATTKMSRIKAGP